MDPTAGWYKGMTLTDMKEARKAVRERARIYNKPFRVIKACARNWTTECISGPSCPYRVRIICSRSKGPENGRMILSEFNPQHLCTVDGTMNPEAQPAASLEQQQPLPQMTDADPGVGEPPRQRAERAVVACEPCKRSKVRCSGINPCEPCIARRAQCVFLGAEKLVVIPERYLRMLEDRYAATSMNQIDPADRSFPEHEESHAPPSTNAS
ncbi:uncharacterized protein DSM5745_05436 [Aspergillus mulundensis]|uniref:Zn(2)-C6 fungal-type domain-containing protein n=1 Tax=Aspergillus mulundensis TaxID=1810919 RepID=A0A3D8RXL0_9EURO|nr:hypothetical protein DSM5745_05436 [Aspergillus mulundensis]RDW78584.1 hypothetical protein DSM5745_05436 [Aspergillus mulundensis]